MNYKQNIIELTKKLCETAILDGEIDRFIVDSSLIEKIGDTFCLLADEEKNTHNIPLVTGINYISEMPNSLIATIGGLNKTDHLVNLAEVIFINCFNQENNGVFSNFQFERFNQKQLITYCEKQYIIEFFETLAF